MTYEEALRAPIRKRVYKIEWMDKHENILGEVIGDVIDGNVSGEKKNGVRRTCNLTLKNDDLKYIPKEDGYVWISNRFKLWSGLEINGVPTFPEKAQGVFALGNPSVSGKFAEKTASIEAMDKFALLNGELAGELEYWYSIPVGVKVSNAVRTTLTDAGMPETKIIITPTIEVTPYAINGVPGDTYGDILIKLAEMINYQVYFDVDGNLVFEPLTNEKKKGVVWTFHKKEVTYLGGGHNYDFKNMKNYIVVYGDNINGYQVKGVAQDDNPFSTTNVDKVGKRVKVDEDDVIPSDMYAIAKAEYLLKEYIQLYESIEASAMPIDIIGEDDIVEVEDDDIGLERERLLVRSFNLPLTHNSEMSMSIWKTRDILTISNASYNFYISTTGSDSNDGLTPETPFKTWARCKQEIPEINYYTINVYFNAGDYSAYESSLLIKDFYGTGSINLIGDTGNPQNYVLGNIDIISNTCTIKIQGFTIKDKFQ
jgi:hypothetical protein